MTILVNVGDSLAGYQLVEHLTAFEPDERVFRAVSITDGVEVRIRVKLLPADSEELPFRAERELLNRPGGVAAGILAFGIDLRLRIAFLITALESPSAMRPPAAARPRPAPSRTQARRRSAGPGAAADSGEMFPESRRWGSARDQDDSTATGMMPAASAAAAPTAEESDLAATVARGAASATPTPTEVTTADSSEEHLRRRSACRWYKRMNPYHNFVLNVVFTDKQIQLVATDSLGVTQGKQVIVLDKDDPLVTVEPVFPGCLVSPQRITVDLTPEKVVTRFWVTPLVTADVPDASVRVWYRNRLVEELPTPNKVVKRTVAHICLAAGLLWPVVQQAFEWFDWSPAEELRRGMPVLGRVFDFLGTTGGTVLIAALLVGLAVFFYRITRPVQASQEEVELFDG